MKRLRNWKIKSTNKPKAKISSFVGFCLLLVLVVFNLDWMDQAGTVDGVAQSRLAMISLFLSFGKVTQLKEKVNSTKV